jgi:hypothetical protein
MTNSGVEAAHTNHPGTAQRRLEKKLASEVGIRERVVAGGECPRSRVRGSACLPIKAYLYLPVANYL